jgi:uncharacterized membrane protein
MILRHSLASNRRTGPAVSVGLAISGVSWVLSTIYAFQAPNAQFCLETAQLVAVSVITKTRIEFPGMLPLPRLP